LGDVSLYAVEHKGLPDAVVQAYPIPVERENLGQPSAEGASAPVNSQAKGPFVDNTLERPFWGADGI